MGRESVPPAQLPAGRLEGLWLYTWAKLLWLEWEKGGFRAELRSQRDQTLTLRCRRPASFLVNGREVSPEDGCVTLPVRAGEKLRLEACFL